MNEIHSWHLSISHLRDRFSDIHSLTKELQVYCLFNLCFLPTIQCTNHSKGKTRIIFSKVED